MRGLEEVKIFRPGYAIEYDYYPPTQLNHALETKNIENLYFAGQINGTTGYEEAGAQGIIAGINAHLKCNGDDVFVLGRDQAYIGVLIDDLVTKGVDEPYRMFTSRAEYRILLRQDNADVRLTPLSYGIGLAGDERMKGLEKKIELVDQLKAKLKGVSVDLEKINMFLVESGSTELREKTKVINVARRPQVDFKDLLETCGIGIEETDCPTDVRNAIIETVEIDIKYEGYIIREKIMAEKIGRLEKIKLDSNFDYERLKSLSTEARQKLRKHRPLTVGQASRISGVSPSDISVLLVFMGR